MPDRPSDHSFNLEFFRMVRSALTHLYDHAFLQNHPLVSVLDLDTDPDRVTRAQGIRRILLECIETLRPEERDHSQTEAARAYAILTYRYVDGLSMQEIAQKLALSKRQAYREHKKGVSAVASLLWDKVYEKDRGLPADTAGDRLEAAQAEVSQLLRAGRARESLSLRDVLEGVSELLAPLTQQMGIQIRMPSPREWPSIVADRVMLRQALLNLMSYALCIARADLVLTILRRKEDLLIGICESPDTVSQTLLDSSAPSKSNEVGLVVAEALIEAQGGRLETHARDGRWEAQIVLPAPGQATVLVVDDNLDIVALLQRYLGGHEISVIGITEGEQAIRQAAELQPQLITLDIMMPNQDGWEILKRLKSSPETKHIPVIVCSVLNEPQLALSMGASDIITKPVSQTQLLEVLQRWLGPLQPMV